jgi:GNAT superfamily N-acetyltransferase
MNGKHSTDGNGFRVRPLEVRDLRHAWEMFPGALRHLSAGQNAGEAIDVFFDAVASGRRNAWVAETAERLIGMVVVTIESTALARLTYLHVTPEHAEHGDAARALAATAIRDTWEAGYPKLAVHTHIAESHVIAFMYELGFAFSRVQTVANERVVEFYRDLYHRPPDAPAGLNGRHQFRSYRHETPRDLL